jgi:hypothetical protein
MKRYIIMKRGYSKNENFLDTLFDSASYPIIVWDEESLGDAIVLAYRHLHLMEHDEIFDQHSINEEIVNSLFVCEVLESSELILHELKNYQEKLKEDYVLKRREMYEELKKEFENE